MNKTVYLYVLDTMADWEAGYIIAELHSGRYFRKGATKCTVKTVGLTGEPVTTMGGVRIKPDITPDSLDIDDAALLLMPGGDTWLEPVHAPVLEKAKECLDAGVTVAAICGATMALAQAGVLDNRYHTSNDLNFLKSICPNYAGEAFYRQEPALTDGDLITAPGVAPLEFAYQVLKKLDVFLPQTLESWYKLYLTHEAKYFFALMESIQN
ncbi:type 1 glutamine amidotransferase family protein [Pelotomaculum propionicicum]|uniref:type 1 glutamine amidotransferase family protein n=1 Tax=Pelotomaculum propionicicum TaxID=258475 RepID=UPI003B79FB8D